MVALAWSAGRLLAALFLVALNGFFVASEFALVRIRSTAVDQMVEEGRPGAGTLQEAVGSLDDYLAATQLGITVASLGLGWIGEPAVAALIEPVLAPVLPAGTLHLVAVGIGFSVVTFLHVVFGELAPKTVAIAEAEKIALLIAPPLKLFYYVFYPGLVVFNGAANWFTGLLGVPPASETDETLSEKEILMVLSTAGSAGTVTGDEVEMIEQVFELDDTTVQDVMVPRPNVVSIPADMEFAAARSLVAEHGHTRYPVIDDTGDEEEIVGYVDAKDLLEASAEDTERLTIAELAREVPLVPETLAVDDLLSLFQDEHTQFAVVIDEWGTLEGIVTVEDTVELVVGDLRDAFDAKAPEPAIREDGEDTYVADGACSIQQVGDALDTEFDTSYGTIGGLTLGLLGGSPSVGETVTTGGYQIEVTAVDGARIETVRLTPVDEEANNGEESDAA
ncbi:HlyC/CorC family transporter [Halonotius terrestris]|uniref:HlyC/CorC family transporter n=1 Tax=Halonotius terrestris TaxID=2487750 RepID=A0A8J8TDC6_9EURY|nr:hemolysin family protein [Halonotius terrestris]TQQ82936.1 HlyC/CorC family transporter [Halonotius terrestris]